MISSVFDCFAIAGDFNIHTDNVEIKTSKEIITVLHTFDLIQHVHGPTHNRGRGLNISSIVIKCQSSVVCVMCSRLPASCVHGVMCSVHLVPLSCVHRDRRPDLIVSGAHSPRFVFRFQKSFVLFQSVCLCLSRGMEVATHYSRHSPLQVGVGVRRDRRECRESTGREPSCPPITGDIRRPAVALPSPPAGCLVPGLPLP